MIRPAVTKFLIFTLAFFITASVCDAQSFRRNASPKHRNGLFSKSPAKKKQVKLREPRAVEKAKKKQEKNEKKLKRDYSKFVKANQKRSIEIQTPEVQERMTRNIKDAKLNYKAKKKNNASRAKKAGRKYR